MGRQQHLQAVELLRVASHFGRDRFLGRGRDLEVGPRIVQELRCDHNQQSLSDTGIEKSLVIISCFDHPGNHGDEKRRAGAEAGGDKTGDRASLIGEPF